MNLNVNKSRKNFYCIFRCVILTLTLLLIVGTTFHFRYLMKNENVPGGTYRFGQLIIHPMAKKISTKVLFLSLGRLPQALLGFSIIFNLKKLFGETRPNGLNLTCISGIKVIAMLMIIAGHSMLFIISGPVLNRRFWEHVRMKFPL